MASEHSRVELKFTNHPQLVHVLGGAVEHVARRAGFDDGQCRDLVAAAEQACRDTFRHLSSNNAMVGVTVQDFADRVEVTVVHPVEPVPAVGLDVFTRLGAEAATPAAPSGPVLLACVDRVEVHTAGGISRMTLVKYLQSRPAQP